MRPPPWPRPMSRSPGSGGARAGRRACERRDASVPLKSSPRVREPCDSLTFHELNIRAEGHPLQRRCHFVGAFLRLHSRECNHITAPLRIFADLGVLRLESEQLEGLELALRALLRLKAGQDYGVTRC